VNIDELTIVGKSAPEPDELGRANARGFEGIELYLEREHLNDINRIVRVVNEAAIDIFSVHTPHVTTEETEWLKRADQLALALDAYLTVHSKQIIHTQIPKLETQEFQSAHGYENNPGISERHLQNMIFDRGHELVLDTAHLFMADKNYLSTAERLLTEFGEQISVIHLCDSTLTTDGLGFGDGAMNMAAMSELVTRLFEGVVVLEVMPDEQERAREFFEAHAPK